MRRALKQPKIKNILKQSNILVIIWDSCKVFLFFLSENILIDFVFIFWNSSIGKGKYNTTCLKKKKKQINRQQDSFKINLRTHNGLRALPHPGDRCFLEDSLFLNYNCFF